MAEYYPLLAKAVGSLPNSTPDTRRVVYERARKALIGQLRMLHPPVPDDDIERESVELDRAVERLEKELASGRAPGPAPLPGAPAAAPPASAAAQQRQDPVRSVPTGPARLAPTPATPSSIAATPVAAGATRPAPVVPGRPASVLPEAASLRPVAPPSPSTEAGAVLPRVPAGDRTAPAEGGLAADDPTAARPLAVARPRPDGQRPIAPQAPANEGAKRRTWIIPVAVGLIVVAVAFAAFKLRDTRQTVAKARPSEQASQTEGGKIAERVGSAGPAAGSGGAERAGSSAANVASRADPAATGNPEVPVAQRAALLIEAPDEPNKVKTYLGTVVWKLNNAGAGPGDGVAVEADIDLPEDRMKAVVTFEKNTDASLPASHTIKVRFAMQPGSASGDVQQMSVPQLRQEDSPSGEPLAGATVPVMLNSFLVGLSPGNAETVNLKQLKEMQWIDVPMLLANGKLAKLTFEKGAAGERDINEAVAAWQKS